MKQRGKFVAELFQLDTIQHSSTPVKKKDKALERILLSGRFQIILGCLEENTFQPVLGQRIFLSAKFQILLYFYYEV